MGFANKTGSRVKHALNDAWAFLYPMLPYLFIGVFIGAFIYGLYLKRLSLNMQVEIVVYPYSLHQ